MGIDAIDIYKEVNKQKERDEKFNELYNTRIREKT